jgi:uncharacterized protein (TIGR00725 family)
VGGVSVRRPLIGVIGAGSCPAAIEEIAAEVGREISRNHGVLVCGGLGGVMQAAARGAKELGAMTVGILPGPTTRDANPHVDIPIATNMGHARNAVIVHTADVLIAVGGSYGTLSEIALALKTGKGVVVLRLAFDIPGIHLAETPHEAVQKALSLLRPSGSPRSSTAMPERQPS